MAGKKPDEPTETLIIKGVPSEIVEVFNDLVHEYRLHERGGELTRDEGMVECFTAMAKNFCENYEHLEEEFFEGTIEGYWAEQAQLKEWMEKEP